MTYYVFLLCFPWIWEVIGKANVKDRVRVEICGRNPMFKTWPLVWIHFALSFGLHQAWLLDFLAPRDCKKWWLVKKLLSNGQRKNGRTAILSPHSLSQIYTVIFQRWMTRWITSYQAFSFWPLLMEISRKNPKKIQILSSCWYVCLNYKNLPLKRPSFLSSFFLFLAQDMQMSEGENITLKRRESWEVSNIRKKSFLKKPNNP